MTGRNTGRATTARNKKEPTEEYYIPAETDDAAGDRIAEEWDAEQRAKDDTTTLVINVDFKDLGVTLRELEKIRGVNKIVFEDFKTSIDHGDVR